MKERTSEDSKTMENTDSEVESAAHLPTFVNVSSLVESIEGICNEENIVEKQFQQPSDSTENVNQKQNRCSGFPKELKAKLSLNDNFKLQDVEKKFILEKFNKKQNPTEWIEKFENECRRHKILNPTNVIEALRFFLSGSPEDWYESNLKKIGLTNWSEWKKSFLTIFADRVPSRQALSGQGLPRIPGKYTLAEGCCKKIQNGPSIVLGLGTLIVGSLTGRSMKIAEMLERRRINICCLQETR
ncbi:hypothetical protein HELRODRAFT_162934 [Helobdella robusta]|uniref:Retrotransposon gag domain-containing protein n=1 Tax=Helobdella robusta TaxID=6412 RepID=T1ETD7_HELRO|nr:hypothetical protein HELRODRAFT_162934 [Helobdella robusta]ESN99388.1 hypothetical protein HELRODRAFT_162934 [Helobdella robusta]